MQLASKIKRKILKVIDRCVCFIINRLPLTFDQKRYACHKIQKTLRNTSFSYSNALSMRQLLIDMCEQKSLSVEDELIYKKRLQELQKNYKRIYIL